MAILTNEAIMKIVEYRDEFLAANPNNGTKINPNYDPEDSSQGPALIPMTDLEWLEETTKRYFIKQIQKGQMIIHRRNLGDYSDIN
jgi:hypothetical protein